MQKRRITISEQLQCSDLVDNGCRLQSKIFHFCEAGGSLRPRPQLHRRSQQRICGWISYPLLAESSGPGMGLELVMEAVGASITSQESWGERFERFRGTCRTKLGPAYCFSILWRFCI